MVIHDKSIISNLYEDTLTCKSVGLISKSMPIVITACCNACPTSPHQTDTLHQFLWNIIPPQYGHCDSLASDVKFTSDLSCSQKMFLSIRQTCSSEYEVYSVSLNSIMNNRRRLIFSHACFYQVSQMRLTIHSKA